MCTCASCSYTNNVKTWPKGEPAGARASAAAYSAHVSYGKQWGRDASGMLSQGPAIPDYYRVIRPDPVLPSGFGYAMPVQYNTTAIRWNTGRGKLYVPEPLPVRKPSLLDLARQLRAEARAERQAFRKLRKAA